MAGFWHWIGLVFGMISQLIASGGSGVSSRGWSRGRSPVMPNAYYQHLDAWPFMQSDSMRCDAMQMQLPKLLTLSPWPTAHWAVDLLYPWTEYHRLGWLCKVSNLDQPRVALSANLFLGLKSLSNLKISSRYLVDVNFLINKEVLVNISV